MKNSNSHFQVFFLKISSSIANSETKFLCLILTPPPDFKSPWEVCKIRPPWMEPKTKIPLKFKGDGTVDYKAER